MSVSLLLLIILAAGAAAYVLGARKAKATLAAEGPGSIHSLPSYYGAYTLLWTITPAIGLIVIWSTIQVPVIKDQVMSGLPAAAAALSEDRLGLLWSEIQNAASGNIVSATADPIIAEARQVGSEALNSLRATGGLMMTVAALIVCAAGLVLGFSRVTPTRRARNAVEYFVLVFLFVCSLLAILTTIGIVFSLVFEAGRFFDRYPADEFLFGLTWSTQSDTYGAIPLFAGTMLITVIAMLVAVPIGLFAAIYLSDYATKKARGVIKPTLEVLAGVPTVVYGFFAALTVAPFFRDWGAVIGLDVSSESALAAGLVMGLMIIPFVSSLSDDVINAVPQSLRDGAYGLGATKSECIKNVILPAALPGIFAAVLLAVSRAIGETMIVVMAAGIQARLWDYDGSFFGNLAHWIDPIESVTTVTVQIVKLLAGDQEFDSTKTLSLFALGLVLFVVTLSMNFVALRVVQKYREKYD